MASGEILTYDDILFKKSPTELGVDSPSPSLSEEISKEIKKGRLPTFGDIKTLFSPIAKVINRSGVKDNLLVTNDDFMFEKRVIIDWKEKYPWLHFGPIPYLHLSNNTTDKIYLTNNPYNIIRPATLIPIKDKTKFLDDPKTTIKDVTFEKSSEVIFSLFNPFHLFNNNRYIINMNDIALWVNISEIKSFENESGFTVLKDVYNNHYTLNDYSRDISVEWRYNSSSMLVDDDNFVRMPYHSFMEADEIRGHWRSIPRYLDGYIKLGMALYPNHSTLENLGVEIILSHKDTPIKNIMFRVRFTESLASDSSDKLLGEYGFVLQLVS